MRLSILGAGAWGSALSISLAQRHDVTLWTRNVEQISAMTAKRESAYLPGFSFPATVTLEASLPAALASADLIIAMVPTAGLRPLLQQVAHSGVRVPLIWACKGFESHSAKLPHQLAQEELNGRIPYGVLSGPSFAQEVAAGLPTALTLAAPDAGFAQQVAAQLHAPRLRIYASDDVVGVEVGGAVKNVMAIAAGICDGMGFGHNARAALITRGLAEITRLGLALGGKMETFLGLTGVGDLILTCTGDLSRNRAVGMRLARGQVLADILRELGHVAEGVTTAREVVRLAEQTGVDMPITRAVCRVLHENVPAAMAVEELLNREPKMENAQA